LLADTLPRWLAGELAPQPQENGLATLCRPVRKEQGVIDWSGPAVEIARAVRAYSPWPGASSTWNGLPIKVVQAGALSGNALAEPAGSVLERQGAIVIVTGEGFLRLDIVQLAGRNPMSIGDFVHGQRGFVGSSLGRYP
jgi:methionyl-tRNA formyltransferase